MSGPAAVRAESSCQDARREVGFQESSNGPTSFEVGGSTYGSSLKGKEVIRIPKLVTLSYTESRQSRQLGV